MELLPEPEALGLLALMLLHESRRAGAGSPTGDVVLLEDQDRSRWNRAQIAEGIGSGRAGAGDRGARPYAIQAAIAAVHAEAPTAAATDWAEIVGLYDAPARADPSPVVELNRAVAVAMRDGPAAGLALDRRDSRARRAARLPAGARGARRLCRRLGRTADARAVLRARLVAHEAGTGAPLPRAPPGGAHDVRRP